MKQSNQIKIYDNGGKTLDRFTAVYLFEVERPGLFGARGMCSHPTSPQGIGCYTSAMPGKHLGKLIKFKELPEACQKLILSDLPEHFSSPDGCYLGCPTCAIERSLYL